MKSNHGEGSTLNSEGTKLHPARPNRRSLTLA